jgi:class 3 adenylate cyclase
MVDLDALEAAGLANARERADLINYLDSLGFTVEEMVEAERRGRLFGLSGDAVRQTGRPTHSLRTAAEALGLPLDDTAHFWTTLGLSVPNPDDVVLSQVDVDALATCADMRQRLGDDGGLLRLVGAAMARLAEAETTLLRTSRPDFWITRSHDELTTAQAWREVAELIPRIGALLDVVHRHHTTRPRLFESVTLNPSESVTCGVGFADLSGFTALTHVLSPAELSTLLNGFGAAVSDVVQADDSRLVKFIGDAVMWVSSTPEGLVHTRRPRRGPTDARIRTEDPGGARLRSRRRHRRRLLRRRGEFGRTVGGRRVARTDPRLLGRKGCAAGMARNPAGTVDAQGIRCARDGLRHEQCRPVARLEAREHRKSRISGPYRHRRLVAAQTHEGFGGVDRAGRQRPGRRRDGWCRFSRRQSVSRR